jgi:D-alanine-D-alanine ligase
VIQRSARLSVAVIQGGPSTEAEVSRASAREVAKALAEAGHAVVRLELDPFLPESLRTGGYDVAFPVAHGAVGEDGSLQGLLEVLDLPYVGSGVLASALAMNKQVARTVFEGARLPVARGMTFPRGDALAAAECARRDVGAELVVKPSSHGSAIGVTRLAADAPLGDVARAIEAVWAIDGVALVEHFARGREVTCGVYEGEASDPLGERAGASVSPVALPPTEILSPNDPFYTYEARYAPGRSEHVCPAHLPSLLLARVQEVAVAAHCVVGCRDLSRVDFIVGDGDDPQAITLLEVNTLPGMTRASLYPEAAAAMGLSMASLCSGFAARAHMRGPTRRIGARPMPA